MSGQQTGVFYVGITAPGGKTAFPVEFRRRAFSGLDGPFLGIFGACALVFFVSIWILSHREVPETLTDKEIAKIQERYARLVLNQPKPKPKEEKIVDKAGPAKAAEKKEEAKIDREKETVVEREERRESTKAKREAKRKEISKAVQSSGIFAAITSAKKSGGGGSSTVTDLLGAAEDVGDIGSVSVSKGTFATRSVDAAELKARKGEKTSGVGIVKESIGKTEGAQLASAGSVNLSAEPAEMKSESGSQVTSRTCIQQVINTESRRIKRVYETWLKRDPALAGQVQVKFTILPSGAVANLGVNKTTTGNPEFDQAIIRYIGRWSFSDCAIGESIEVVFPFVFEAQA